MVILYRKTDWSALHSIVKIYALSNRLFAELDSLADVIIKTSLLEKVQGAESVTISLNQEVLVSTDLRHSLIREQIKKLEKDRQGLI